MKSAMMDMRLALRGLLCFHFFDVFVNGQASTFDTGTLKFTVSDDSVPYDSVTKSCVSVKSTELSINSDAEFDQVRLQVATDMSLREANIWVRVIIQVQPETSSLSYLWPSGSAVGKAKFVTHFGEPDGAGTGCSEASELCVGMRMIFQSVNLGAYHLYDLCCNENLQYMCDDVPEGDEIIAIDSSIDTTVVSPSVTSFAPYARITTIEVNKERAVLQCHLANATNKQILGYQWYLNGNLHHEEADDRVSNNITIFGSDTYSSSLFTCAVEHLSNSERMMTKQSEPVGVTFYASTFILTDATVVECNQAVALHCNTKEQNFSLIEGFSWKRHNPDSETQDVSLTGHRNVMDIKSFQSQDVGNYSCAILYWDNTTSFFSDDISLTLKSSRPNITAMSATSFDNTGGVGYTYEITCLRGPCAEVDDFIFERTVGDVATSFKSVNSTYYIRYAPQANVFAVRCATVLNYAISSWSDELSLLGEVLGIADSSGQKVIISPSEQSGKVVSSSASSNKELSTTSIQRAPSPSDGLSSSSPFPETTSQTTTTSLSQQTTPGFTLDRFSTLTTLELSTTKTMPSGNVRHTPSLQLTAQMAVDDFFIPTTSPIQKITKSPEIASQTSSLHLTTHLAGDEYLTPTMSDATNVPPSTPPISKPVSILISQEPTMDSAFQTSPLQASHTAISSLQASMETSQGITEPNPFSFSTPPVIMSTALVLERNSNVSLICGTEKMDGGENTEYTWFFNDVVISSQIHSTVHMGSFDDMNVGEYKCAVMIGGVSSLESNTIGLALIDSESTIPEYSIKKPIITSDPAMPEYGSSVTLSCLWNHSFVLEYLILLNETIIYRSAEINGYVIEMFEETYVGEYRCAVDLKGQTSCLSELLYLNAPSTVTFTAQPTVNTNKPFLTSSFTVVYVGHWNILSCFSPQNDIEEYVILKVQSPLKIVYRGSSRETLIKNVRFSDGGDYICLYKIKDGTSSERSDSVSVEVIPENTVCYCPCPQHVLHLNVTDSAMKEMASSIKQNLSVGVDDLSATVRRFVSAQDDRQSSAGIGTAAFGIVCTVFSLIVVSDCMYIYRAAVKLLKRKMNYF